MPLRGIFLAVSHPTQKFTNSCSTIIANLSSATQKNVNIEIKRMNPQRVQREVRREMERMKQTCKPSSFAQDYMREEIEKNKKLKKKLSSIEKEAYKVKQFALKQEKRKEKHRGH